MTPAQRQIVLDGLTAQFGAAEWWPAAAVTAAIGSDVLAVGTIRNRTIAADVARPIAGSIAVQFPNPNPAGLVAVRSSDVTNYVMTTL